MDQIDRLKIFVRVFECESFTEAAHALRIPRSTASVAVQELEAKVGAQLFHRTTRRVNPTHDGHLLYDRAIGLLADIEDTETMFRSGSRPRGFLRIDAPSRIAHRILAPALPEFLDLYPEITLEVGGSDRPLHLIHEGVDCVIRVGDIHDPALSTRHLGDVELINCASPAYLAHHGQPRSLQDLDGHQLVKFASSSKFPAEQWEYVSNGKVQALEMSSRICAVDAENYIAFCIAGLGLIQIPAFDVQEEIGSGLLVEVLPEWRAPPMPLRLAWPHQSAPPRRVKVFMEWVSGVLAQAVFRRRG